MSVLQGYSHLLLLGAVSFIAEGHSSENMATTCSVCVLLEVRKGCLPASCIHEDIKNTLNCGNACYHSEQNF